jgi:hypothetical protein
LSFLEYVEMAPMAMANCQIVRFLLDERL